jgi:DNA polymerase III delta prime subunit
LSYPKNFFSAIFQLVNFHAIEENLPHYLNYIEHHRNRTLQEFVINHGLNQLNEVLNTDHPVSIKPAAYFYSLSRLLHFEEMANQVDYYKYDIHFYSLHFALYNPGNNPLETHFSQTIIIQCTMKIRGSSELRPKISIGNRVRIRPTQESCEMNRIDMIEMTGIVLNYSLATEEAIILFSAPKHIVNPFVHQNNKKPLTEQSLDLWNSLQYHIRFLDDRTHYGFMQYLLHNVLSKNNYLQQCFFPIQADIDRLRDLKMDFYRRNGGQGTVGSPPSTLSSSPTRKNSRFNQQQEKAINEILDWCSINRYFTTYAAPMPPFVLFGPPGTGKTSVVIETILRILQRFPGKRILACAPSEAAADVMALRLISSLSSKCLHRLNWWQRLLTSVPANLLPYCNQYQNLFELYPLDMLTSFQVIITTCHTVGSLFVYQKDLQFDVVIIDEASQAIEMEVLLPLSFCKAGGVMVLAGDIHQLGPSTKFPLYRDCTPFLSLQERLLHLPFYADCLPENFLFNNKVSKESSVFASLNSPHSTNGYSSQSQINLSGLQQSRSGPPGLLPAQQLQLQRQQQQSINQNEVVLGVFLNQNYRTHECILQISSKLFYNNKLVACADHPLVNKLSSWSYLKSHPFLPMCFFDVKGKHAHEMDSPSFYNDMEVNKVVEICTSLAMEKLIPLKEIGVIAAFRRQVLKIRSALRAAGLSNINVGGVEDFQVEVNSI